MSLGMERTMQQECFGNAFLHAIAAVSGCALAPPFPDDDSIDWTVNCNLPRRPKLDVQMKCTELDDGAGDIYRYKLKRKNYDDLIITDLLVPRILVLVTVPPQIDNWLQFGPDQLVMRRCAYWTCLMGQPERENRYTVTVPVPRANLFTVSSLSEMMHRINDGGMP